MSTFLVYLYKKKPLRALKHPYTSIHPYTKFCAQFCAQILSNSVLSFSSSSSLDADHYFLSIFHWLLLSLVHSALVGIICPFFTHWWGLSIVHSALVGIIPLFFTHWWGLSLHFSRTGGDYPSIFLVWEEQ